MGRGRVALRLGLIAHRLHDWWTKALPEGRWCFVYVIP